MHSAFKAAEQVDIDMLIHRGGWQEKSGSSPSRQVDQERRTDNQNRGDPCRLPEVSQVLGPLKDLWALKTFRVIIAKSFYLRHSWHLWHYGIYIALSVSATEETS